MVVLLPWAPFIIATAVGLFLYDRVYGLSFLLAGFALFNRNFAYTHVEIGHFPIYVTECCLAAWGLSTLLRKRSEIAAAFRSIPPGLRVCWLGFLCVGLLSTARGLWLFPVARVLRDSAMVYYSIAGLLLLAVHLPADRLRLLFRWVATAVFLRSLLCLMVAYAPPRMGEPLIVFYGQAAGGSLWIALSLLAALAFTGYWPARAWMWLWMTILLTELMGEAVRSSWTGFAAGAGVLVVFLLTQINARKLLLRVTATSTLMLLLPGTVTYVLSSRYVRAPVPVVVPGNIEGNLFKLQESKQVLDPTLAGNRRACTPWQSFQMKLRSFTQGSKSGNVMTRLLMWRNALSELFGVGLYSPSLRRSDLPQYHLPYTKTPPEVHVVEVHPAGLTGLPNDVVRIHFVEDGTIPPTSWLTPSRAVTVLFGIPFGKLFLPAEIIYCVVSPQRYDPHNSLIAVFYRMGASGFVFFTGIVLIIYCRIWRILKAGTLDPFWSGCLMTTGAGMTYHLVHSLTDNTLENAFKGLVFWLLVGLAISIMRRAQRAESNGQVIGS